mgnify:CR=1 FL=1|tara:strand:+ start:3884 stop:4753 length:870 start_codon:yes stop_codon:yes gene_type:complete
MGLIKNIFIVAIVGVLLFLIINHFFLRSNIIWDNISKGLTDGSTSPTLMVTDTDTYTNKSITSTSYSLTLTSTAADKNNLLSLATDSLYTGLIIPNSAFPNVMGSNFMFSIWFFIDDYTQNLQYNKYIGTLTGLESGDYAPTLFTFLTPNNNNLGIGILTQSGTSTSALVNFYFIENIPLQKWNCLIISVVDRTMDIYLEGKLINSFILAGYYVPRPNTSLYIGSNLSQNYFNGYITRARYDNGGVNPQEAYSIYKEGINTSFSGDFFNKYRLKVGLYEYNDKVGGFSI